MTQATLLVAARAAGLVSRAPAFAHPSVPPPVRAGLALALAVAVAPGIAAPPRLDPAAFALAAVGEFALGAAIGLGAALLYDAAYAAGRTIDDYLGVRGSVPNAAVTSAQGFGRLWSLLFLAAYVLLGGWIPVVVAFADSFGHVAAGAFVTRGDALRFALALPQTALRAALLVATPAIAVAAALQLGLAAVARVVPRFASFTLAFPVVLAGALVVTLVALPLLAPLGAHPRLVVPWAAR